MVSCRSTLQIRADEKEYKTTLIQNTLNTQDFAEDLFVPVSSEYPMHIFIDFSYNK